MFVKTIVLDGFKSYGQRTEITGFDNLFNAITGLNGSGKSNILDAICFVLGITNLGNVRASSLQDLIYKSGQAGVHKAAVSITFDNRDSGQCPPGFENFEEITITRQVMMGGKNNYMINGTMVPSKKVQDLFCSVQLNVNNPHFMIMQGKITKVLNMKAPEILSMIEESAGTKMYETKKQATQRTIDKKDAKLSEFKAILQEEILPRLEKLREERAQYLEYQRVERELEHIMGLYVAWQYVATQRAAENASKALEEGEAQLKNMENRIVNNKAKIKEMDDDIEELTKNAESEASKKVQEMTVEVKAKEKVEAKMNASLNTLRETIKTEETKQATLEKDVVHEEKTLKNKQTEFERLQTVFKELRENDKLNNEAFTLAEKRYEALAVGMEVNEQGETETLQEQLINVKQEIARFNRESKEAEMQLDFCKKQLKDKERDLGTDKSDYEKIQFNFAKVKNELKSLENGLKKFRYSEEKMSDLQRQLMHEIRSFKERINNFEAQKPYVQFHYTDPEPDFNRKSVKGVVCRLIQVKDNRSNVAIETTAGARLYNVVIDSDVTGKKLLKNGNLQKRTTFIPLNNIQAKCINANTVKFAEDLVGKENVQIALAHVNYDKKLQVVMDFIFGNTFICKDINVARQVAFHNRIKKRCVTVDGDIVDPAGTLSGGAPQKGGSILLQLNEIIQMEKEMKMKENELKTIEQEMREYAVIKENVDIKQHELNLLNDKLKQTTYHRRIEEVNGLKEQIKNLNVKIEECKLNDLKFKEKCSELERRIKHSNKDDELREATKKMNDLKQKTDKSRKEWKQHEQNHQIINLELKELEESIKTSKIEIEKTKQTIIELKKKCNEEMVNFEELQKEIKEMQMELKREKAQIADNNKEIQKKITEKERLQTEINEITLDIRKFNHELKKLQDDCKNCKSRQLDCMKKVKEDNRFMEQAKNLTHNEGCDLEKRIRNAQEAKNKLIRKVNTKAQIMVEQEEKQYTDLIRKQKIVENDRAKLITIIADLDKQKQNILKLAHEQISKDFGSIFGTLLPGSNAKLVPPPNKTILQGLDIKVCLGNVWKESLTELSGGQRSLAALSLILAMLLFKPAPLYILDEVDAALDLSHTQNIGNMLRSHFQKSQFIIVSLKDGMFNNANVLFRTKFVDGVSTVTRTVNRNR